MESTKQQRTTGDTGEERVRPATQTKSMFSTVKSIEDGRPPVFVDGPSDRARASVASLFQASSALLKADEAAVRAAIAGCLSSVDKYLKLESDFEAAGGEGEPAKWAPRFSEASSLLHAVNLKTPTMELAFASRFATADSLLKRHAHADSTLLLARRACKAKLASVSMLALEQDAATEAKTDALAKLGGLSEELDSLSEALAKVD